MNEYRWYLMVTDPKRKCVRPIYMLSIWADNIMGAEYQTFGKKHMIDAYYPDEGEIVLGTTLMLAQ